MCAWLKVLTDCRPDGCMYEPIVDQKVAKEPIVNQKAVKEPIVDQKAAKEPTDH